MITKRAPFVGSRAHAPRQGVWAFVVACLLPGCADPGPADHLVTGPIEEGPELVLEVAPLPDELAALELFRVVGLAAAEGPEGQPLIALADAGNHRIVLWDPVAGTTSTLGRGGSGPEEFRRIQAIWGASGLLVVEDGGNRRRTTWDLATSSVRGTTLTTMGNLQGGGALMPGGLFVEVVDDGARAPFRIARLDETTGLLEEAGGAGGFPGELPPPDGVHPAYDRHGLIFPPLLPVSLDLTVSLGSALVWIRHRTGEVLVFRGGDEGDEWEWDAAPGSAAAGSAAPKAAFLPGALIEDGVRAAAETGEQGMMERPFMAFLPSRPGVEGRHVFLPRPLVTEGVIGWSLEAQGGDRIVGRIGRLAPGVALPYGIWSALPLPGEGILVGHDGGVTLLVPTG